MSSVSKKWTKAVRRKRTPLEVMLAKQDAWLKGKNVVLNIPNPNPHETGKPVLRVNAKDIWYTPKPFTMQHNPDPAV